MLNKLMNKTMKHLANKTLKTYGHYPVKRTALILVDVQSEFLSKARSGWQAISKTADSINFKENLSSLISFSRDQGFSIIYAPYTDMVNPVFETPAHEIMKEHTQQGGKDVQLTSEDSQLISILPTPIDAIVKDRSGLSVFSGSSLHKQLQDDGIEHLVFAGSLINIGLDSSVRDAVEYGYHATLITDCSAAMSELEYQMATKVTFPRYCQTLISNQKFQSKVVNNSDS